MPTGYTAPIYEGKDLSMAQFLLRCARNFGALLRYRDEGLEQPIPEVIPLDDYYAKHVAALRAEIAAVEALSDADAVARAEEEQAEARRRWVDSQAKTRRMEAAYRRLIDDVEDWEPPTRDHVALKEFALEQLRMSRDGDCHDQDEPKAPSGPWRERTLAALHKDLAYALERAATAKACNEDANAWLRALRDSLR